MICDVGEGTVHRLWEPLAAKQRPANGYAGKFSTPYCIAAGFVRGNVGLDAFTDAAVNDPRVVALAAKVRYRIDPQNPYPKNFTGHIRAVLNDGSVVEERQPHMRGGVARAADAPGHRGQIHALRPPRRLGRCALCAGIGAAARPLRRPDRSLVTARLTGNGPHPEESAQRSSRRMAAASDFAAMLRDATCGRSSA